MGFYMKNTPIIKAVQWFKNGDHPEVNCGIGCEFGNYKGASVTPGDWIIEGFDRPLSDEYFKTHYREMDTSQSNNELIQAIQKSIEEINKTFK